MRATGLHILAARGRLKWSALDLADKAGVGRFTVLRIEAVGAASVRNVPGVSQELVEKVLKAIEDEGITFIGGANPGIRWLAE